MNSPDPIPSSRGLAPNGATATGSVSVALVGIIVWALQSGFRITVPPDVIVDLCILAGFFGTYLHPAGRVPKAP